MTGAEMKRRFRASATAITPKIYVSAGHPEDGGVVIQSEMTPEDQQQTSKRFHCLELSFAQVTAMLKAIRKADSYSRRMKTKYDDDLE